MKWQPLKMLVYQRKKITEIKNKSFTKSYYLINNTLIKYILIAFSFLTIIPINIKIDSENDIAKSSSFFPLVGLFIGSLLGLNYFILKPFIPLNYICLILIIENFFLTRCLHLDGLLDMADGFWGNYQKEKILKIMDDPHKGTFGTFIAIIAILNRFITLSGMSYKIALFSILSIPTFSRFSSVLLAFFSKPAIDEGLGKIFSSLVNLKNVLTSFLITLILLFFTPIKYFLTALITVLLCLIFIRFLSYRKIQGINGDIIGAQIELSENFLFAVFYALDNLHFR